MPNKNGNLTSLSQLARFQTTPGPVNFHHYKGDRAITISGDVDKTITTPLKVSNAVQQHFDIDKDYPGMALIIGGEAEESEKSFNELLVILGIAAVGVYFLLVLLGNDIGRLFQ